MQPLVVLGSVWAADLDLWEPIVEEQTHVNWIIAPHQWTEDLKKRIQEKFPQAQHWSSEKNTSISNVVVLDVVGVLSRLYRFANAAYVGGGFGRGVHSVLEPAAAGIPVAFGPKHANSREALAFLHLNVGTALKKKETALNWLQNVQKKTVQDQTKTALKKWFEGHSAGSQKIAERMEMVLNKNK